MKSATSKDQDFFWMARWSNDQRRIAPRGELSSSIAAGPRRIIKMEGKMSNAIGNTILIGAR